VILYYENLGSTNQYAKELLTTRHINPGTVICAWRQTAGQGQHGRSFASPLGGLYFSVLSVPQLVQADYPLITLAVGLACREVLSTLGQVDIHIKWPNDLYIENKKMAGILCETIPQITDTTIQSVVVIGVGINVNNMITDFPEEIQPLVTTLREYTSSSFDLSTVLKSLVSSIQQHIEELHRSKSTLLHRWQQYDIFLDRSLIGTMPNSIITGRGLGIDHEGRYRIRDDAGAEHALIGGQLRLNERL
jgi:BirA family transcriptional regulator, biotin operon repressor / biotin---[acetyl-CoA-carboxylase] ligase